MKSKTLMCFATLILFAPAVLASTTLYVNGGTGSDSHNCLSPTTACKTIRHAISLASSGDTVMVAASTYTENLSIGISLSIVGSSAQTTIIEGGAFTGAVVSSASARVILSNLTIRNSKTSGFCGFPPGGAGVYNRGTLTITNSIISGNTASARPIRPENSSCSIEGGGILNNGTLTIDNSTISGNSVTVYGCLVVGTFCEAAGGGIASTGGSLTINSSTISDNTAVRVGGCVMPPRNCFLVGGIFATSSVTVSNSTISGNRPDGIVSVGVGKINNSTISGNSGEGISGEGSGTMALQNSVIAYNSQNCSGKPITSKGYNLSSDGSCNFTHAGDLNNHDPLLGPLQNNGGPTETMALLPGSPAIDAGNPSGCTDGEGHLLKTDQRGMPRPNREDIVGCDIGAYERQSD